MGLIIRLFTLWSVLTWFCCVALSATFGFDFTSCNCSGPVSEWWLYPYDAFITFWRDVHNFFMSVLKIISDESVFCCCFHSGIWTLYHNTVLVRFGWSKEFMTLLVVRLHDNCLSNAVTTQEVKEHVHVLVFSRRMFQVQLCTLEKLITTSLVMV